MLTYLLSSCRTATRMSASCAAGTTYFLETNSVAVCAPAVCVITEQHFDLRDRLTWVAGMVTLLSSKERRPVVRSGFAPNDFMVLFQSALCLALNGAILTLSLVIFPYPISV